MGRCLPRPIWFAEAAYIHDTQSRQAGQAPGCGRPCASLALGERGSRLDRNCHPHIAWAFVLLPGASPRVLPPFPPTHGSFLGMGSAVDNKSQSPGGPSFPWLVALGSVDWTASFGPIYSPHPSPNDRTPTTFLLMSTHTRTRTPPRQIPRRHASPSLPGPALDVGAKQKKNGHGHGARAAAARA